MEMEWNPLVPELAVKDLGVSRAFYADLIGCVVRFERDDPPFAYLDQGAAQLMIEEDHDGMWLTAEPESPRGRGINLQIEVDNVTALRDRLVAASWPLFRDLADTWYGTGADEEGQREFLVQDPDGYLLRFVQPLGARTRADPQGAVDGG